MTLTDREVLEVLGDEPELLAVADAITETQRLPRRPRRPARAAALAAALAVAALVLLALVAPWRGGGSGIVERAAAAIGNGRVLHLVTRSNTGEVLVELATGKRHVQTMTTESWSDDTSGRFHGIIRYAGRIVGEFVLPDDLRGGQLERGQVDPAYTALSRGYRRALEEGTAKLAGKGTYKGHPVYWLRFASVNPRAPGTLAGIDPRTYRPVVLRLFVSPTRHVDQEVIVFETLPFDERDFTRTWLPPQQQYHSGGSSGVVVGESPPGTSRRPVLKAPWLTAGKEVAGLDLASVHSVTLNSDGRVVRGIELGYGALEHGFPARRGRYLILEELQQPEDTGQWSRISTDVMSITQGEVGDAEGTHAQWTGKLRSHGLYVTIETSAGERAVAEAARALRPAP